MRSNFFDDLNFEKQYYFVHSYHAIPEDDDDVSASISYGDAKVTAAIGSESV